MKGTTPNGVGAEMHGRTAEMADAWGRRAVLHTAWEHPHWPIRTVGEPVTTAPFAV
jgi:hypothetical protein